MSSYDEDAEALAPRPSTSSAYRLAMFRTQVMMNIEAEMINIVSQVRAADRPYIIQTRVEGRKGTGTGSGGQDNPLGQGTYQSTQNTQAGFSGFSGRRNMQQRNGNKILPRLPRGEMYVKFGGKLSMRKFTTLAHVMAKVYEMLVRNQTCTVRELYYQDPAFYGSQKRLEDALSDLCHVLRVPREALGIEATAKGLIAGNLRFKNKAGELTNVEYFREGMLMPSFSMLDECEIESDARQILIVEKDAIFQRLIAERIFDELGPTILITGKGYPDIGTLKVLRKLRDTLKLPVFAFVDCDPWGIDIASIIRWGSSKQLSIAKCAKDSSLAEELTIPNLIWIGLQPSEIPALALPSNSTAIMNERDVKKLRFVREKVEAKGDQEWSHEIGILAESCIKAELEALFIHPRFAGFYIHQKIKAHFEIAEQQKKLKQKKKALWGSSSSASTCSRNSRFSSSSLRSSTQK